MGDNGIAKGDVATGALSYVIIVFNSIAIYNVIELTFIIWTTFKRHGGLYWWSFNVATYGIAIYSTGFILMNELPYWQSWLYATCVAVGWPMMVTGQSMVLYSRLHLILLDRKILRAVLWMIIFNAIIGHVPTIVFIYGANVNNPGPWITPYSIYEKVQVTIFFLQECIISALYISETIKTMKLQREIRPSRSSQRLLKHLIFINILIIGFDITILGLEYASKYDVQTSFKAMAYAAKLKLEFSILNKLVEVTTAQKDLSGSSHLSATGANSIGFPLEVDDDGVRERRRPGVSYRASIRGGQDVRCSSSQDLPASSLHNGVTLTREVEVKREDRRESDGDSMLELRDWTASGGDGSSTGAIPMEEIEHALETCSQVHLAPETWPHDGN
jgi:hypothetical protein